MRLKSEADRRAAAAALHAAGERFDGLLALSESDIDEMVDHFGRLRKQSVEPDGS